MNKAEFQKNAHDNNNFGLLRLLAALFVLISHSFGILNKGLQQPGLWYKDKHLILSDVGLYIFFTISGFLVTQSLFNSNSLKHYLWKRFLRIFPALAIANLVCIIIGCFVTRLTFRDYLLNVETWSYFFKNTTVVVNQFTLPGVFDTLKDNSVNASLWTILIEVECYIVLLLTAYIVVIRKWLFLTCFVLFQALGVYLTVIHPMHIKGLNLNVYFTFGTYFYLGSLFYCFKDNIRFKWFYANILMAVALLTVYTFLEPVTLAVFIAYCVIIIGTSKAIVSLKGYDLSYGFYLYAFPVQQLVLLYFGYDINVWMHILISSLITLVFAFFSWKYVEKPFLQKKDRIGKLL
ncbi:MAG: acyltransferase [Segetibacter sp.]|nr:acyltransferase [Segetibacter sp.]